MILYILKVNIFFSIHMQYKNDAAMIKNQIKQYKS